ncbi:MAG: response regulator [Deltaproteobacteria bacterium]|nr:response regulator [Deltaproteobacteria bacterium]
MKILIVDDDLYILDVLESGLTDFGYEVVAAEDGEQAMCIIETSIEKAESVDLMVTDLNMPVKNGLELIRSAREVQPGLAAILMTGARDNSIRKEVNKFRGCGYIYKPFKLKDIIKTIRELEPAV